MLVGSKVYCCHPIKTAGFRTYLGVLMSWEERWKWEETGDSDHSGRGGETVQLLLAPARIRILRTGQD